MIIKLFSCHCIMYYVLFVFDCLLCLICICLPLTLVGYSCAVNKILFYSNAANSGSLKKQMLRDCVCVCVWGGGGGGGGGRGGAGRMQPRKTTLQHMTSINK